MNIYALSYLSRDLYSTAWDKVVAIMTNAYLIIRIAFCEPRFQTWHVINNCFAAERVTAKLHYIEPQGTGVNGSKNPMFEISHRNLFALIVAGPFVVVL